MPLAWQACFPYTKRLAGSREARGRQREKIKACQANGKGN